MSFSFTSEHLRHRRLVHAANALVATRYPTKLQCVRLVELWLSAGLATMEKKEKS